jgi:hypothetical protein
MSESIRGERTASEPQDRGPTHRATDGHLGRAARHCELVALKVDVIVTHGDGHLGRAQRDLGDSDRRGGGRCGRIGNGGQPRTSRRQCDGIVVLLPEIIQRTD